MSHMINRVTYTVLILELELIIILQLLSIKILDLEWRASD